MGDTRIQLTKEKETLLITLYAKAVDSRAASPVLGDRSAQEAVDKIDYDFSRFTWDDSVGAAARAKLLDIYTREFLSQHPHALVLHLACGLDGRYFRIAPPAGVSWYDVDYPEVTDLRRQIWPEEQPGYHLIGSSVNDPDWLEQLPADRPVFVVAEGLVMYLHEDDVRRLLQRITDHFRTGELAFDVISGWCTRLMRRHPSVKLTGATMEWGLDDPHLPEAWNPRLHLVGQEFTVASRVVPDLPRSDRIACHLMNLIPPLRRLASMVRYRF